MRSAVIVDAVRTPLGKRNGKLREWHPVDLAAELLNAVRDRNDLDPAVVDDVVLGCVMQVGEQAANVARNAVLADITCDSDGKIDRFVSLRESKRTLELHELADDEPYFLAVFLVGAYQETLGDLHNLFGDTHVVHIKLHDEGGWWIEETVKGDTASEVLKYMSYDVDRLYPQFARDCERAVREGRLSLEESQALRRFYELELNGYTYLEPD